MSASFRHRSTAYASHALGRFVRQFGLGDHGAAAVEFALLSLPLMMLVFGLIELAMVMLTYTTLQTATEAAGRRIRTGEFQHSNAHNKGDFKTLVCGNMSWLSADCANDLYVDVQTFSSFGNLAANKPASGTAFNPNTTCFSPGNPADIVLVRAYLRWKLLTPGLSGALQNMGDGSGRRLLSTATAFRNEPFDESPPVGAKC